MVNTFSNNDTIIDNNTQLPAVRPNAKQVDLYGYTSMTMALLQRQAKTIKKLEAKIGELEKKIEKSK